MAADRMSGIELIAAERKRQIDIEGWSPFHDDGHSHGELAIAAARYAIEHTKAVKTKSAVARAWRWASCFWKPRSPIRNLARAGALIAAEIDRLQRQQREKPDGR